MADARLPSQFADLERYVETWCLATERERYAERLASSMEAMRAFYEAMLPRVDEALAYCDTFPLDAMPDASRALLQLAHSFVMVSFPVEVWGQQHIPDTGDAALDRVIEPAW
jgi:hypothetical protein